MLEVLIYRGLGLIMSLGLGLGLENVGLGILILLEVEIGLLFTISHIVMNLIESLKDNDISFKLQGEHHHASRGWVQLDCPFCSPNSGRFLLGINLKYGNANCWKCGRHSIWEVGNELGIPIGVIRQTSERFVNKKRGKLQIPSGVSPDLTTAHQAYLNRRGFDYNEIERLWSIGSIGIHAKLGWRVFIPIHLNGEIVSWTTRAITNDGLRYISAKAEEEAYPAKELLYGEDYVRHSIIVCEGPLDVWKIGPGAVATLGTAWSQAQLRRIAKYPYRTVLFDSENEAQKRAQNLCNELSCFPGTTQNVILEDFKDPGSASKEGIRKLRKGFLDENDN